MRRETMILIAMMAEDQPGEGKNHLFEPHLYYLPGTPKVTFEKIKNVLVSS